MEREPLWMEQCAATRAIAERFGTQSALDYLIGEKLLDFMVAAEAEPGTAEQLPLFVSEVASIFHKKDLEHYFRDKKRFRRANAEVVSKMRDWLLALKGSNVLLLRRPRH